MKTHLFLSVIIVAGLFSNNAVAEPKWNTPYMRCFPFDDKSKKIGNDQECPRFEASIIQLLARPEIYDGKQVIIRGFVHLEFEGRGIYIHKQDYEHGLEHNALWVGGFRNGARVKNCQDNYVTIFGIYRAEDYGHMGMWSGTIEDISVCTGQ